MQESALKNLEICVILNIIAAVCGFLKDLLSLLQLTPGLYEFKVIVDGQNAHGEGYVNVTVKPGMFPSPSPAWPLRSLECPLLVLKARATGPEAWEGSWL